MCSSGNIINIKQEANIMYFFGIGTNNQAHDYRANLAICWLLNMLFASTILKELAHGLFAFQNVIKSTMVLDISLIKIRFCYIKKKRREPS